MTTNEADELVRSMIGAGAEVEQRCKIVHPYSKRIYYTITLPEHKAYLSVRPKKRYFFFAVDDGLYLSNIDGENFNVLMSDDVRMLVLLTMSRQRKKRRDAAISAVYESITPNPKKPEE